MTSEQLQAARRERWRQSANPLLTAEDALKWLEWAGLCLYLPRRINFKAPAPSFVEATMGEPNETPGREAIENAASLMRRLVADGHAIPLNLFGGPSETPDFLASREAFPYIYSLVGSRDWKSEPGSKTSPMMIGLWKLLEKDQTLTVEELQTAMAREITESAVVRGLLELWGGLRVLPVYKGEDPTAWSQTQKKFKDQLTASGRLSQTAALSGLVSIYLEQVIAAEDEEIEVFLSTMTARSKVRETVNGLSATRQLSIASAGTQTLLYIAGTLPEFPDAEPATAEESVEGAALAADLSDDKPADGKFVRRPASDFKPRAYTPREGQSESRTGGFERKPAYGRSAVGGQRPPRREGFAPGSEPWKNREEGGASESGERTFRPRPQSGEGFAARPAYGDRKSSGFGDRKPGGFGDRKPGGFGPRKPGFGSRPAFGGKPGFGDRKPGGFQKREGGEGRPPFRREGGEGGDRPSFQSSDRPGGFSRGPRPAFGDRPKFGGKPGFGDRKPGGFQKREGGEGRPPFRREGGEGGDRPSFQRSDRPGGFSRGPRPAFGDKPRFGGKPGFGDRKPGGFQKREGGEGRPPFRREGGEGGDRPSFQRNDRPGGFSRGPRPAFGDKPRFGGKPGFDRKPGGFQKREGGDGEKRPFFRDRGDKPNFRREGGEGRPPFRREGGEGGDRPSFQRSDRPGGFSRGPRPAFGGKPGFGDKPRFGSKPGFDRKPGGFQKREGGDGEKRPFFRDRGDRPAGDRPNFRREGGAGGGERRGGFDRKPGFGGKPSFGGRPGGRPGGDRPAWKDRPARPAGEGGERSGGFGDRKPGGFKPRGEGRPSFGGKPGGGFKPRPGGSGGGFKPRPGGSGGFKSGPRPGGRPGFGGKPGGFKPRPGGGGRPGGFKPREGGE